MFKTRILSMAFVASLMLSPDAICAPPSQISELVQRDGLHYAKYSSTPFTGRVTGYLLETAPTDCQQSNQPTLLEGDLVKWEAQFVNGRVKNSMQCWYKSEQSTQQLVQSKAAQDEPLREWYEKGKLRLEVNTRNGQKHGIHRGWHENGQLSVERSYVNGKKHGLSRAWFETGQLMSKETFEYGKRQGPKEVWYEHGDLAVKGGYVDGKR